MSESHRPSQTVVNFVVILTSHMVQKLKTVDINRDHHLRNAVLGACPRRKCGPQETAAWRAHDMLQHVTHGPQRGLVVGLVGVDRGSGGANEIGLHTWKVGLKLSKYSFMRTSPGPSIMFLPLVRERLS